MFHFKPDTIQDTIKSLTRGFIKILYIRVTGFHKREKLFQQNFFH